ncbi:MAG: DUF1570 domain-containing protein [Planctomycetaceae bacterium]
MPHGRLFHFALAVVVAHLAVVAAAGSATGQSAADYAALEKVQHEHEDLRVAYDRRLQELLADCDREGLADEAAVIRALSNRRDPEKLQVRTLPRHVQEPLSAELAPVRLEALKSLRRIRGDHAAELYLLSRRAVARGFSSYAYGVLQDVVAADPDHAAARRLLGFVRSGDEWVTPFEKQQSLRNVWHDKYGWLPKAHVERYEKGERYLNRRWVSAAQEAEIRRDFRHAWEIRTEHFLVKTNHSLERGVEVARKLEIFHDYFVRTFAGFFNTPQQLRQLFEGGAARSPRVANPKPYVVYYYRTKDEYQQTLIGKIPQIGITNGLYYTTDRISYFFHDEDVEPTLYHEATHQMFYESVAGDRMIAEAGNFWIIEGIACYLESFRVENGSYSVGDPNYVRFLNARFRYLNDGYYVPLARFASHGMRAFQMDTQNIARNYSQASGLAHFFMHHDGGRHRDALVTHLTQLYASRPDRVQSLAELTGVSFAELDKQYGEYMKAMEAKTRGER